MQMRDILDSFLTECANITVTVDGVDEGLNDFLELRLPFCHLVSATFRLVSAKFRLGSATARLGPVAARSGNGGRESGEMNRSRTAETALTVTRPSEVEPHAWRHGPWPSRGIPGDKVDIRSYASSLPPSHDFCGAASSRPLYSLAALGSPSERGDLFVEAPVVGLRAPALAALPGLRNEDLFLWRGRRAPSSGPAARRRL